MKNILFLIPTLGGGGAERVLVNLVNNLDKEKYKITVQTLFDVGANRQYLKEHIEYIPGFKKMFSGNVLLFKLFTPQALYKLLVKKRYDIAVSYLEGPAARIVAGCPYDSKLISWIHTIQYDGKNAAYSYRSVHEAELCQKKFSKVVCVSEDIKKDYLSIYPFVDECCVKYNTNETEIIVDKSTEKISDNFYSQNYNIISLGRLIPEKGYDRLVKAHKRLLLEGLKHHIYIFGEGNQKKYLEEMIKENQVQSTFHLLGYETNPYKYIKNADMFICSSRREGFSTAVTEALILGIPVVSTEVSGAKELLGKNDEYGLVVDNSTDGVYEGIRRMLENDSTLPYYKKMSQVRGLTFSKEITVNAIEDMFDNI